MKKILLTAAQHDLLKTMLDTAIEAAHEEGHPLIAEMRGVWHACARATTEPAFEEDAAPRARRSGPPLQGDIPLYKET